MKMGEMGEWTKRFKGIMKAPKQLRDVRLANMMTDMEQCYKIPFLNDEAYNNENPHVIKMYHAAGEARSF